MVLVQTGYLFENAYGRWEKTKGPVSVQSLIRIAVYGRLSLPV